MSDLISQSWPLWGTMLVTTRSNGISLRMHLPLSTTHWCTEPLNCNRSNLYYQGLRHTWNSIPNPTSRTPPQQISTPNGQTALRRLLPQRERKWMPRRRVTRDTSKRGYESHTQRVTIGSQVYVRKEHFGTYERHHKLARKVTVPYVVTE